MNHNDFCSTLLSLVSELNRTDGLVERFDRFLGRLKTVVGFDAASVLVKDGNQMIVLASMGLSAEARVRHYPLVQHPRLRMIVESIAPVVFPPDSTLPDPFDGLLEGADFHSVEQVHSCLGCPLVVQDEVVGCLTLDALKPGAFAHLSAHFLQTIGALAGASLRTALMMQKLERENSRTMEWARELQRLQGSRSLIGDSNAMQKLRQEIGLVARSPFPVLILGETGTGKELVAKAIHQQSPRVDGPWIAVNCAALPENLAESELFGHVRGAFTGAEKNRPGKFELADGGTLFLDEIGDLPMIMQAKILRVIQEGELQRVGSNDLVRVDVRIVAATHRDLESMVAEGTFRRDLFHRLHVFPLRIAPLRERVEDIEILAATFAEETSKNLGLGRIGISLEVLSAWKQEYWPGNVRELENRVRATIIGMGIDPGQAAWIQGEQGGKNYTQSSSFQGGYKKALDDFKGKLVRDALKAAKGSPSGAAELLGMDRGNFSRLMNRYR